MEGYSAVRRRACKSPTAASALTAVGEYCQGYCRLEVGFEIVVVKKCREIAREEGPSLSRRRIPVLFALVLLTLLVLPPLKAAAADEWVTIGYLPLAIRSETVMIRGTAPVGSAVDFSVNGTPAVRVYASQAMAVYTAPVPLEPGFNRITAQLVGTHASAGASLYRITESFTDLDGDPLRDDIEILATLGIVCGDGTGRFLPKAT